ncbi:zinc dependent phospholipase C family protein [Roseburia hominis]|uniref:zinc dependent phospholipase C family protein n=1 Tax=Roseburia hominis TaxID=301301 RepID=UPI0026EC1D80|nr:zinc dependent phospholipase C family protein [Roseburia hominis]MCI7522979.1 zinc dependent phospholipase C family protein [Roseburia hominis]
MQKKGHLLVASALKPFFPKYHFWLSLGSICPDLLFHTFIKGHTYPAAWDMTVLRIGHLRENGRLNRRSLFMLGYILHYVEDFFTLPHNPVYRGTLLGHPLYEKKQYDFFKATVPALPADSAVPDLIEELKLLHAQYLAETPGLVCDRAYIFRAAACTARYFAAEFAANEISARLTPNPVITAFFSLLNS